MVSIDQEVGIFNFPLSIFSKSYSLLFEKYGGTPNSISYNKTPNKYQSTALPWPYLFNISGAK